MPSSASTPALSSNRVAALVAPIALRWPKASMTNCTAAASLSSARQPFSDSTIATASKICEGEPASCPSALSVEPSASLVLPTLGATSIVLPPADLTAFTSFWISPPSEPSAIRMPMVRPSIVAFMFFWMDRASLGGMSIGARAALALAGTLMPSPAATRVASSSSTLRRLATTLTGTSSSATLDSSKVNEDAICARSLSVCDFQKRRAWL